MESAPVKLAPKRSGRRVNLPVFKDQAVPPIFLKKERPVQVEELGKFTEKNSRSHG